MRLFFARRRNFEVFSLSLSLLRENMIFYGVLISILCVGATGLLFFGSLDVSSLSAYGIVVANAWGISTGILLVYGGQQLRFSGSAARFV